MKTYIVTGQITFSYKFEIEAECIASAGAEANERASNALDSNDSYYLSEKHQEQDPILCADEDRNTEHEKCSNPLGHFEDNQGYCHCCGILLNPEQALLLGYISKESV